MVVRWGAPWLPLLLTLACSTPSAPHEEHRWETYDGGAAYPETRPKLALPPSDFALVPGSGTDRITVVDLAGQRTIAQAPVGRNAVIVDGPHQIVANPRARITYVADAYPVTLAAAGNHSHGTSVRPGYVQALAFGDLAPLAEARVDPNPGEIAISDDGKRIVVTHFDLAGASVVGASLEARRSTISLVDPSAMLAFGTPEPDKLLVCVAPHGLTLSHPDAKRAFVACYGEDAIAIVDLEDIHAPVLLVPLGDAARTAGTPAYGPYGVAGSPDGSRIAIATRTSKEIRFLDVATSTITPLVVPMLGEVYVPAWSHDGKLLYAPTRGLDAIAVLDTATGAVVGQQAFDVATCVAPVEAALSTDGAAVYVVCEGADATPGAIVTLDAQTLAVRGRVEVGLYPGRPYFGRGP